MQKLLPKIIGVVVMLAVVIGLAVGITVFVVKSKAADVYTFPQSFKFGAASASYQIEGAWNEDGKSASIWDTVTHDKPGYIRDSSSGDVAADSYHMYDKDIAALENVGVST
jgi:beta-glucosidase